MKVQKLSNLKCWYAPTGLHGITTQKAIVHIENSVYSCHNISVPVQCRNIRVW